MRHFFIFIFFSWLLFSKTINYDVKFGIFGTVGNLSNTIHISRGSYTIQSKVQSVAWVKKLFGDYTATYTSKGIVRDGRFYSSYFKAIEHSKKGMRIKEYRIDRNKGSVEILFMKKKGENIVSQKRYARPFRADDDLLTLYFNAGYFVKTMPKKFVIKSVGLEKQNGRVLIEKKNAKEVPKKARDNNAVGYLELDIVSKNIKSRQNNLFLAVGSDGFVKKALIKDVFMYGDVRVVRRK